MFMYKRRGVLPARQISTVYTFGAPSVFCVGPLGEESLQGLQVRDAEGEMTLWFPNRLTRSAHLSPAPTCVAIRPLDDWNWHDPPPWGRTQPPDGIPGAHRPRGAKRHHAPRHCPARLLVRLLPGLGHPPRLGGQLQRPRRPRLRGPEAPLLLCRAHDRAPTRQVTPGLEHPVQSRRGDDSTGVASGGFRSHHVTSTMYTVEFQLINRCNRCLLLDV